MQQALSAAVSLADVIGNYVLAVLFSYGVLMSVKDKITPLMAGVIAAVFCGTDVVTKLVNVSESFGSHRFRFETAALQATNLQGISM